MRRRTQRAYVLTTAAIIPLPLNSRKSGAGLEFRVSGLGFRVDSGKLRSGPLMRTMRACSRREARRPRRKCTCTSRVPAEAGTVLVSLRRAGETLLFPARLPPVLPLLCLPLAETAQQHTSNSNSRGIIRGSSDGENVRRRPLRAPRIPRRVVDTPSPSYFYDQRVVYVHATTLLRTAL